MFSASFSRTAFPHLFRQAMLSVAGLEQSGSEVRPHGPCVYLAVVLKTVLGSHFGVDAPPSLEPILVVGLGCSLGVRFGC